MLMAGSQYAAAQDHNAGIQVSIPSFSDVSVVSTSSLDRIMLVLVVPYIL